MVFYGCLNCNNLTDREEIHIQNRRWDWGIVLAIVSGDYPGARDFCDLSAIHAVFRNVISFV